MAHPLTKYVKVKDNYCLFYLGHCDEYVAQLRFLRPQIEKELPGLNLYIGCREGAEHILSGEERIIVGGEEIRKRKKDFGCLREIRCNMKDHPILEIINESNLSICAISNSTKTISKKALICANGTLPTKNLLIDDLKKLKNNLIAKGYEVHIGDDNHENYGLVAGVECLNLYEAGFAGKPTILIPTGIGTDLYKRLFTNGCCIKNC